MLFFGQVMRLEREAKVRLIHIGKKGKYLSILAATMFLNEKEDIVHSSDMLSDLPIGCGEISLSADTISTNHCQISEILEHLAKSNSFVDRLHGIVHGLPM